jgi:diguanylate cyclase (GGDEF)-like protein
LYWPSDDAPNTFRVVSLLADLERQLARAEQTCRPLDPERRFDLLLALSEAARLVDPRRALAWAGTALDVAVQLGDPPREAAALLAEARSSEPLGQLADSLAAALRAQDIFRSLGDAEGVLQASSVAGSVYERLGELDRALPQQIAALEQAQATCDIDGQIAALNSIGVIHARSGRAADALAFHERSLALARTLGDPRKLVPALNNLGIGLKDQSRLDEAEAALTEALALVEPGTEDLRRGTLLSNLGLVYERQGRALDAEAAGRESLALFAAERSVSGQIEAWLVLGRLYVDQDRREEAERCLADALAAADGSGNRSAMLTAHTALATLTKRLGRFDEAVRHLEACLVLERAAFDEDAARRLRNLSISLQVEQARREAEVERARSAELAEANARLELANAALREADRERSAFMEELERIAREDSLTGLSNRRDLDERLRAEFHRARRHGRPLSVALADIDGFKAINDRLSHAVGDETLRTVARILREGCRQTDLVARYGGEEFALVFIETELPQARVVCEKLRAAVEAWPWHRIHPELSVTVSMGATSDVRVADYHRMLTEADSRMYEAKRAGKNRVVA